MYLQKIMKSIFSARRRIQELVSEGEEENDSPLSDHLNHMELKKEAWLDLEKSKKEFQHLQQEI